MTVVDAPSSLLAWSGGLGRLFRPVGYASDFDICEQFDPWLLQWRLAKTCPADLAAVSGLSEALRLVLQLCMRGGRQWASSARAMQRTTNMAWPDHWVACWQFMACK